MARFGGDEFVVLLNELSKDRSESIAEAGAIAEVIRRSLAEHYMLRAAESDPLSAAIEHHCTASLGVVVFTGHEASQDELIDWADSAMYQAKEDGRNLIRYHRGQAEPQG